MADGMELWQALEETIRAAIDESARANALGIGLAEANAKLRAATAQGERVALASSETLPAGTTCEFEVQMMRDELEPLVEEWLAYGELRGFGQWRNSGKGRFTCERVG